MKITKLTVKEISELQPTAVAYAEDRGLVLGGYELPNDWNGDLMPLLDKSQTDFQRGAEPDSAEPPDGDGCSHVIIILPND